MTPTLREANINDRNFLFTTWIKGLYHGNEYYRDINFDIHFRNYKLIIENILQRPNINIHVLCIKESPEIIIGYAVTEQDTLHWLFIKPNLRNQGLIHKLINNQSFTTCTHLTRQSKGFILRNLTYNPFIGGEK